MKAPSDGVLLALFVLALAVTVTSTLLTLSNFGSLGGSFLTGAATSTATGEANVTVNSVTSITNQNTLINFGSGYVNASCNFCEMNSNGTATNLYANGSNMSLTAAGQCCVGFSSLNTTSGFLLENTGNLNVSVGYTCTGNCTHALYMGGNLAPGMGGLELRVQANNVAGQSGESGSTDTAASCVGGGAYVYVNGWNITNSSAYGGDPNKAGLGASYYVVLSSVGHWLCGNATSYPLSAANSQDAGVVDINITIPHDAPATGIRSSFRLTFNATSAG